MRLVGDELTRALCRVQALKDRASKLYGRALGKSPTSETLETIVQLEAAAHDAWVYCLAEMHDKSARPAEERAKLVARTVEMASNRKPVGGI